ASPHREGNGAPGTRTGHLLLRGWTPFPVKAATAALTGEVDRERKEGAILGAAGQQSGSLGQMPDDRSGAVGAIPQHEEFPVWFPKRGQIVPHLREEPDGAL